MQILNVNIPIKTIDQDANTVNISNQVPVNNGFFVVNHLKDKNCPLRAIYYQPHFGTISKASFIENTKYIERTLSEFFKTNRRPKIQNHKNTQSCWLCDNDFERDYKKIHPYCTLTGNFLVKVHQK